MTASTIEVGRHHRGVHDYIGELNVSYNAPVMHYGWFWRFRGITCISRSTGMTCHNGYGHGFFIERHTYRVW